MGVLLEGSLQIVNGKQQVSGVDINLNLQKKFLLNSALFHSYQKSEDKLKQFDQSCINIFAFS